MTQYRPFADKNEIDELFFGKLHAIFFDQFPLSSFAANASQALTVVQKISGYEEDMSAIDFVQVNEYL